MQNRGSPPPHDARTAIERKGSDHRRVFFDLELLSLSCGLEEKPYRIFTNVKSNYPTPSNQK
jgi:hypothetical protein